MTAFALSDCIRATPSRTLGALLLVAYQGVRSAVRQASMGPRREQSQGSR